MGFLFKIKSLLKKKSDAFFKIISEKIIEYKFRRDNLKIFEIQNANITLNEIENAIFNNLKGAYLRFGDGDVMLMNNLKDSYQMPNKKLAKEMVEAFSMNESNVYKSLAIHSDAFGFDEGMFFGNHKNNDIYSKELLLKTHMFFNDQKIYSPVALHFIAIQNPSRANAFLKLLKSKVKLFVGNERIQDFTFNKLFGNVPFVKTPSENAYNDIDRIYAESIQIIEKLNGFGVIVIAMGCGGRPLIKRLYNSSENKIFLFDFGSLLDGLDNNLSRKWLKLNKLNRELLLKDL